uniref:Uncharacterized protein n=1 Tax=Ditylenchus dipsaci TaxID=166011 RepID=A0A915EUZ9_9BILA
MVRKSSVENLEQVDLESIRLRELFQLSMDDAIHQNCSARNKNYFRKFVERNQQQLVNEFHPAVKNVALAGQNLVRAYDSVNKAFYLYTASLYGLSHSGKYAEKEARHHATQLQRTAESLKSIYSDHFKWRKRAIEDNVSCICKKEKHLVKAVDKGKMNQQDLENFYETQLALTMDQQFQRYNFFSQCHQDLLKKHFDWSKYSMEQLKKLWCIGGPTVKKWNGKTQFSDNGSLYEKNKSPRSLRKEFEQRNSSQASSSPRLNYRQIIESTDNEGQFIFEPRSDTNYTDSHAAEGEGSQKSCTLNHLENKQLKRRAVTIYEQFKEVQQQQKQSQRSQRHIFHLLEEQKVTKLAPCARTTPTYSSKAWSNGVGSECDSSDGSVHVRDKSLDAGSTSRPSSANRMSHPIFCTSDYGRVLECVNPYAGQGDNQLTMEVGEK